MASEEMSLRKSILDLQRKNQAIPGLAAALYDVSAARILRRPESRIVNDIAAHVSHGTMLDLGSGTGYP